LRGRQKQFPTSNDLSTTKVYLSKGVDNIQSQIEGKHQTVLRVPTVEPHSFRESSLSNYFLESSQGDQMQSPPLINYSKLFEKSVSNVGTPIASP